VGVPTIRILFFARNSVQQHQWRSRATLRSPLFSYLLSCYIVFPFNFHGSVHHNHYSNIYPTKCNFTQFILSGNCSVCFGWYLHPSLGAQTLYLQQLVFVT
jgi:hypothetical protein